MLKGKSKNQKKIENNVKIQQMLLEKQKKLMNKHFNNINHSMKFNSKQKQN